MWTGKNLNRLQIIKLVLLAYTYLEYHCRTRNRSAVAQVPPKLCGSFRLRLRNSSIDATYTV
jgi:hypothetical protein